MMFRSVGFLSLFAFALTFCPLLHAQDCFSAWAYRLPITIDNSANSADAVDVQVRVEVNTAALVTAGQLLPNGLDLRFVDDANCCVPLCHWVESGINTPQTVIWVKVPFVPANGTSQIVMLHHNPAATYAEDGFCTFDFFDDFSTTLDTARWITRGTPSVSSVAGGYLTFAGNSNWEYVRSRSSFSYPIGIQWKGRVTLTPSAGLVMGFEGGDNRYTFRMNGPSLGTTYDTDVLAGNAWEDVNYPGIAGASSVDAVFEIKSIVSGSGKIQISSFCNQTVPACTTSSKTLNTVTGTSVFVGFSSYSSGFEGTWDYVFVRKRMPVDLMAVAASASAAHTPPLLADTLQFCENDTALLDAGVGFLSYDWSTGDTTQVIHVASEGMVQWAHADAVCIYVDSTYVSEREAPEVEITPGDLSFCPGGEGVLTYAGGPYASVLWSTGDTLDSIHVSVPGTLTLTVSDTVGCTSVDTATVTLHAVSPPVILSTPLLPACEGTVVTLEAGPGYVSYTWSTGDVTPAISIATADTFSVEVVDSNGCSASGVLFAEFWPLPAPVIADLGGSLDAGAGYASYQWFVDGSLASGETSQFIIPFMSGYYSVEVTDSNGCTGTSDSLEVIFTQLFADVQNGLEATLHPNPYHDQFQLTLVGLGTQTVKVEVTDMLGRQVQHLEAEPRAGALSLTLGEGVAAGQLLLVRATQGDRSWSGKVLRQ